MSGHLRFCFVAFLLAGLSTSPASPNPFDDLFNSARAEVTAPAPAEEDCLPQPGKSTADGQHWVYRFDGHRKCWFQAAERTATVKKRVRHHAAQTHVAAPKEDESALRKGKAVVDARDELLRSALAETPQPSPPAPEIEVVNATPDPATGAAALLPPAPATDQLTSDRPTPRQLDVETLLAAAPPASDAVATSVATAPPAAIPVTEAGDDESERTATWLGVLLIGLGFVFFLVGVSRTLWGRLAGRATSPPEDGVGGHRGPRNQHLLDSEASPAASDNFRIAASWPRRYGPVRRFPPSYLGSL
jgi:hypothetical protein